MIALFPAFGQAGFPWGSVLGQGLGGGEPLSGLGHLWVPAGR